MSILIINNMTLGIKPIEVIIICFVVFIISSIFYSRSSYKHDVLSKTVDNRLYDIEVSILQLAEYLELIKLRHVEKSSNYTKSFKDIYKKIENLNDVKGEMNKFHKRLTGIRSQRNELERKLGLLEKNIDHVNEYSVSFNNNVLPNFNNRLQLVEEEALPFIGQKIQDIEEIILKINERSEKNSRKECFESTNLYSPHIIHLDSQNKQHTYYGNNGASSFIPLKQDVFLLLDNLPSVGNNVSQDTKAMIVEIVVATLPEHLKNELEQSSELAMLIKKQEQEKEMQYQYNRSCDNIEKFGQGTLTPKASELLKQLNQELNVVTSNI